MSFMSFEQKWNLEFGFKPRSILIEMISVLWVFEFYCKINLSGGLPRDRVLMELEIIL